MSDSHPEQRPELDRLVVAARSDREALGRLFEAYHDRVLSYCARRLFGHAAAEDVCSEVFLFVAKKMRAFPGETERDFRCWVYRIATNEVNAYVRKSKNRSELLESAVMEQRLSRQTAQEDQGYDTLDWPAVVEAIARLKPREQAVLTLRVFDGVPYDEIGQILGVRAATARVAHSRAVARLKQMLGAVPVAGE